MGKNMDKLSGKTKKAAVKATDNQRLEAEGHIEEGKGKVKDALD